MLLHQIRLVFVIYTALSTPRIYDKATLARITKSVLVFLGDYISVCVVLCILVNFCDFWSLFVSIFRCECVGFF